MAAVPLSQAVAGLGWAVGLSRTELPKIWQCPKSSVPPRRLRMNVRAKVLLCAVAMSGYAAFAAVSPAQALSMSECSAKYKAAKADGSLNGQKWADFRKAQCGTDAAAAPAAPAAAPAAAPPPAPAPKTAATPPAAPAAPAAPPMAMGNAVFPSAVDPKYAKES